MIHIHQMALSPKRPSGINSQVLDGGTRGNGHCRNTLPDPVTKTDLKAAATAAAIRSADQISDASQTISHLQLICERLAHAPYAEIGEHVLRDFPAASHVRPQSMSTGRCRAMRRCSFGLGTIPRPFVHFEPASQRP